MNHKSRSILFALLAVPGILFAVGTTTDYLDSSGNGRFGLSNTMGSVSPAVAIGWNNANSGQYSLLVGDTLANGSNNSLVVGRYNNNITNGTLVVGNGTSSSARKNVLEALATGSVNMPLSTVSSKVTIGTSSTAWSTATMQIYGTADIASVPVKGGISMGAYTAQ